ncbi:extensin family protein [Blastomonas sp.]|uniref:extensin-like domain-containing protein n=1 Tax=Blastomonas sp. TaxID=1909299 RepID=UPI003593FC6D
MKRSILIRWARRAIWFVVLTWLAIAAYAWFKPRPQDLPWTELSLHDPVGMFTGRKLAALTQDRDGCLALLAGSGLKHEALATRGEGQCIVPDAVRVSSGQDLLALSPASVAPSCPVMAALLIWQTQSVQPAAQRILGSPVTRIEHFGSYSCRRMYGRSEGAWSEHATANAIDISGFVLADGRRISVQGDWAPTGEDADTDTISEKARFLRAVRDDACDLFSTVLSPEYNAAHHDHFHIDQAERGATSWRTCR